MPRSTCRASFRVDSCENADFTPFWIANAIQVTGNAKLAEKIAERPEVDRIEPSRVTKVPEPLPGKEVARINAIEWNIDRVNAPASGTNSASAARASSGQLNVRFAKRTGDTVLNSLRVSERPDKATP
ncbi:hypothetical protein [Streptosporangium sp. OZ121]|uniref:hypothetical protein n=1 Tax=Streptosporangium sp. OZ121 TaxID=3444183 RepID=UPI003F7A990A